RGDTHDADAERCEIAGCGEIDTDDTALGRGVVGLADLAFESGDRGGGDDDAALARVERLVGGHRFSGQAHHVEGAGQEDVDGATEGRQRITFAIAADHAGACRRAAVNDDAHTQRRHRGRDADRIDDRFFAQYIRFDVADA